MSSEQELGQGQVCFIISPIGSKLEPLGSSGRSRYEESLRMWEEVFEPAARAFGMAPIRSDKIAEPGEIPDQIFTYLRDADVVIADLSHANANVMYELGLRHSRPGKVTVQIGEYERLPFDVTTIRTIQFRRTEAGLVAARDDLIDALRAGLSGDGTSLRATSIFSDALSNLPDNINADVARSVASEPEEQAVEEPGMIETLAEGEGAIANLSNILNASTEVFQLIGANSVASKARIEASDAAGKGFAGRLLIARELAEEFEEPSAKLESYGNDFYDDVLRMDAMIQYLISRVESEDESGDELASYFTSTLGLIDSADKAAVGIVKFRNGAQSMKKISSALAPRSKTLSQAATRFLEGIAVMGAWREPIERLAG